MDGSFYGIYESDESSDLGITSRIKNFISRPNTGKPQNTKNKGGSLKREKQKE